MRLGKEQAAGFVEDTESGIVVTEELEIADTERTRPAQTPEPVTAAR